MATSATQLRLWAVLAGAVACEVVATAALKRTNGLSNLRPLAVVIPGYAMAAYGMSQALAGLPLAVVYAAWSGFGSLAAAGIGLAAFGEVPSKLQIAGAVAVVAGVAAMACSPNVEESPGRTNVRSDRPN